MNIVEFVVADTRFGLPLEAVEVTGVALTKFDGTAMAGNRTVAFVYGKS